MVSGFLRVGSDLSIHCFKWHATELKNKTTEKKKTEKTAKEPQACCL